MKRITLTILLLSLIASCQTAQERARLAAVDSNHACKSLGRTGWLAGYSEAVYEAELGTRMVVISLRSGVPEDFRISEIADPEQITNESGWQRYQSIYRKICNEGPPFARSIPYVVAEQKRIETAKVTEEKERQLSEERVKKLRTVARAQGAQEFPVERSMKIVSKLEILRGYKVSQQEVKATRLAKEVENDFGALFPVGSRFYNPESCPFVKSLIGIRLKCIPLMYGAASIEFLLQQADSVTPKNHVTPDEVLEVLQSIVAGSNQREAADFDGVIEIIESRYKQGARVDGFAGASRDARVLFAQPRPAIPSP